MQSSHLDAVANSKSRVVSWGLGHFVAIFATNNRQLVLLELHRGSVVLIQRLAQMSARTHQLLVTSCVVMVASSTSILEALAYERTD